MKPLVVTSLLSGSIVLPVLLFKKEYGRTPLYVLMTFLSYTNHRNNGKFLYLDRFCALTCIIDLWEHSEEKYQKYLLSGVFAYLLRHIRQDEKYHVLAHLIFALTTGHRFLFGASLSAHFRRKDPLLSNETILLCVAVLLQLPSSHS